MWWPESVTPLGKHWFLLLRSLCWLGHEDPAGTSLWHSVDHLSHVGDHWGMELRFISLINLHLYVYLNQTQNPPLHFSGRCLYVFIYIKTFSKSASPSQVMSCHNINFPLSLFTYLHACLLNGFVCEFPKKWKGSLDLAPPLPPAALRLHSPTCCPTSLSAGGMQSSWIFYCVMVLASGLACRSATSWRWDITTGRASS